MGSLRKLALLGAFAVAVPNAVALAADMPVYEAPPPAVPYEVGSAWYLRGDLGYKWYATPDARFDLAGYGNMIDESLGNTGVVGFGFGYQFSDYFRTDLTVDYEWPGSFHGRLRCPGTCGYSDEYADISAWSSLVNFYLDFPLNGEGVGGITPYIGAGIGASYLVTSDVNYINPDSSTGTWDGAGKWNFAWAAMVGASYAVSRNWLIDLNYRYIDLGKAVSGKTLPQFGNRRIEYDDITAQEIRLGFRYLLN
ncbi:MAG: porin family protein [Bauldia sp.]|nr:MAG: porin family protein [Bauldia sp.]